MGNKAKCTPVGKGTIAFQTESREWFRATNVLHVPRLGMNLLSVSQLQDKGYGVYFIKEKVCVKHLSWKKKVQIGIKSNRLYRLQLESPMALISSHGDKDLNNLWHRRMGHLHHGALRILRSTIIRVPDLSTELDDVCRGCVLGKYAKATFPRSKHRAKSVLGLIHSDICGPMSLQALSGAEYFLTFIDDHSRKTWINFLKTKDEVLCRFKEFKALVENLTGKKIKVLRSDIVENMLIRTSFIFVLRRALEESVQLHIIRS